MKIRYASVVSLVLVNLFVIFLAISYNWSLLTLLWTYWFQSVIIGIFHFFKLRRLNSKQRPNESITQFGGGFIEPRKKVQVKGFDSIFLMFYGVFHLVFLIFLIYLAGIPGITGYKVGLVDFSQVLIGAGLFLGNHTFSYLYHSRNKTDLENNQNPLARIIPMHTTLFILVFLPISGSVTITIIFLLAKTVADVVMHIREHGGVNLLFFL